jgi:sterol desaturase/sphingolipid hydroxylase (fatty acid hydroxylase superfamily)
LIAGLIVDGLVPAILVLAGVEWLLLRRREGAAYDWRESLASLGVAAGHRVAGAVGLLVLAPLFEAMWRYRLFTVPMGRPWAPVLLFLGVELAYYWQHRLSHSVRWLWASHAVHHTSEQITVAAAYRLAWTDLISGTPMFAAPLVIAGFPPRAIVVAVGVVVAYQFWIHTELVPRLPWVDGIFNSPSNHRVHHAVNDGYVGRNFGGLLVVFDRIFGTYAVERRDEPPRYGRVPPVRSYDPIFLAFHEWIAMGRDVLASRSPAAALRACFGRPPSDVEPDPVREVQIRVDDRRVAVHARRIDAQPEREDAVLHDRAHVAAEAD